MNLLPVTILVEMVALQPDDDECHDGLDDAELKGGLFAETQKADVVRSSGQTAGAVEAGGLDGFATDLRHNVPLSAQVFVTESEEVVDHKS